ncbi:HisA/HisF-related TIM barrel protein [Candidatus Pelagibacter sp.]|jgi:cyclase|nr:HisA/HisF-related TIM barrel protein [Candidatus Pelagibacter sp.]
MRIISRLDIKTDLLIKSIQFDGVRKIGNPEQFAVKYFNENIDEIFLINNTGSLYNTQLNGLIVKNIRSKVSIPIAGGGGIRSLENAENLINSGCDKIVINSLIHENPKIFSQIISMFGSSSVVGSIQYSRIKKDTTYYKMARETTGIKLSDMIKKYIDLGCGEILITEINNDGRFLGLDLELIDITKQFEQVPILIGGGFKDEEDIEAFNLHASAVVISSALHYEKIKIKDLIYKRQ